MFAFESKMSPEIGGAAVVFVRCGVVIVVDSLSHGQRIPALAKQVDDAIRPIVCAPL